MAIPLNTPGVYLNELNAFPNSVVPVNTAVPAFVGYTERASAQGQNVRGKPVQVDSLAQFEACFGVGSESTGVNGVSGPLPAAPSIPVYHLVPAGTQPGDCVIGGTAYDLLPDPGTLYYLRSSLQLYFANGGGPCYVVSAGLLGSGTGSPLATGQPWVNPNVLFSELKAALATLESKPDVTLIVVPEATLLPAADYASLLQEILSQCGAMQNRMGILDVYGAQQADPLTFVHDQIEPFRAAVGQQHLKYGAAYYPFLKTTIRAESEITCDMLGGAAALAALLPEAAQEPVKGLLASLQTTPAPDPATRSQTEIALRQSSPTYVSLCHLVCERINILPPSGAIAGVYARVDAESGVWVAPANVSPVEVVGTTLALTDDMQSGLNVDPLAGKSVNAIRNFLGRGVLVWGARTLDGNSQDWRYIQVVRTVIMIEQSVKLAMQSYVFQPNDANTWSLVRAALTSFLTQLWSEGALVGAAPSSAFSVEVGLGVTMTAQEILNGRMAVSIGVALTHPAEFIVLTFNQEMQTS